MVASKLVGKANINVNEKTEIESGKKQYAQTGTPFLKSVFIKTYYVLIGSLVDKCHQNMMVE
jgi:hypothetical protein